MSKSHVAILVVGAVSILGSCGGFPERRAAPLVQQAEFSGASLRTGKDLARGRRWELGWDAVIAYDAATNRPIRRVALEGASLTHARGACNPDMLLDRTGALLVSSNSQPVLWRVSPERFEVERFELRVEDERRDVGFSRLSWSPDGRTLHAVDASTREHWRIDLASLRASRVAAAVVSQPC